MARTRQGRKVKEERSAGGVVFRRTEEGTRLLLIRDAYDNWGLPKGHIEASESPKQAALREVMEETGLSCEAVGDGLMTIDWYFRASGHVIHKYCEFFLMENSSGAVVPDTSEGITEGRWFSLDDAVRDVSYDNAREVLVLAVKELTGSPREAGGSGAGETLSLIHISEPTRPMKESRIPSSA